MLIWIYSWTIYYMVDLVLVLYTATVVLNGIMVFRRTLLDDINERKFLVYFRILSLMASVGTTALAYMIGVIPPSYRKVSKINDRGDSST